MICFRLKLAALCLVTCFAANADEPLILDSFPVADVYHEHYLERLSEAFVHYNYQELKLAEYMENFTNQEVASGLQEMTRRNLRGSTRDTVEAISRFVADLGEHDLLWSESIRQRRAVAGLVAQVQHICGNYVSALQSINSANEKFMAAEKENTGLENLLARQNSLGCLDSAAEDVNQHQSCASLASDINATRNNIETTRKSARVWLEDADRYFNLMGYHSRKANETMQDLDPL